MNDIRFDIVARNLNFDEIRHTVLTLEDIWDAKTIPTWLKSDNAEILAVRKHTGLKDKNGKEIYEGDFVLMNPLHKKPHEIRWHDGSFVAYAPNINHTLFEYGREFEVIGNIYENPELLKANS